VTSPVPCAWWSDQSTHTHTHTHTDLYREFSIGGSRASPLPAFTTIVLVAVRGHGCQNSPWTSWQPSVFRLMCRAAAFAGGAPPGETPPPSSPPLPIRVVASFSRFQSHGHSGGCNITVETSPSRGMLLRTKTKCDFSLRRAVEGCCSLRINLNTDGCQLVSRRSSSPQTSSHARMLNGVLPSVALRPL